MGACGCCTEKGTGEVFKPRNKRWCTDVLCLLLLVLATGGLVLLGAMMVGVHPDLVYDLIYPTDSYGNNCGKPSSDTASMGKVMYPQLDEDIVTYGAYLAAQQYLTFLTKVTRLCVAECPEGVSLAGPSVYGGSSYPVGSSASSGTIVVPSYTYTFTTESIIDRCFPVASTFGGVTDELCVSPDCHDTALNTTLGGTLTCATLEDRPSETSTWKVCPEGTDGSLCALQQQSCSYSVKRAPAYAYSPENATSSSVVATETLAEKVQLLIGAYEGVLEAYVEILVFGLVLPIVLGFGWCVFLWFFAGLIVYLMLVVLVLFELLMTAWLCYKSGWFDSISVVSDAVTSISVGESDVGAMVNSTLLSTASSDEKAYFQIAAVVSIVVNVLTLLLICAWAKAIRRCIAIIKETTKVFRTLPVLMVWPMQGLVFQLGFVVTGLFMVMYTLDDEVWTKFEDEYGTAVDTSTQYGLCLYCILVCLWLVNFCKAITWTSMSCAVAYWFVADNKPGEGTTCCKAGTGATRLWDATWTIVSKHTGSMAVGSFIIALCQTVRIVLKAVDNATKAEQDKNLMFKLIIKCSQCAMWCLQKTVEFISYYGYVFVAIEGDSFCRACKETFVLCCTYPSQVAVNQTVKKLLGLLMTWSTPMICAVLCFYSLDANADYSDAGYSPLYAAIFVFILGYVIADNITTGPCRTLPIRVASRDHDPPPPPLTLTHTHTHLTHLLSGTRVPRASSAGSPADLPRLACAVFDCCIDTIYLCAFKDMKENDPPKFMSNDMREGFGIDKAEAEGGKGYEAVKGGAAVSPEPAAAGYIAK